jgi:hypothetical protein
VLTFSAIPDIFWVSLGIWVLLDGEIGTSGKEKAHQGTTLALSLLLGIVLGLQHRAR